MRVLISILWLIVLPGAAAAFWACVTQLARAPFVGWVLAGCLLGILLERSLRRWPIVHVFDHELAHALVALLFLRPVRKFVVTESGGWVQHGGGRGGRFADDVIGFAPYFLPTFTLGSVFIRPWLPAQWFPWFDVWIGATLTYHTVTSLAETRSNWHKQTFRMAGSASEAMSDIGARGYFYSVLFILTSTLLIHGLVFAVWVHGYPGTFAWWRLVWVNLLGVLGWGFARVTGTRT